MPKFASIRAEREFWDGHDAIEVLGEEGWKVSEAGATKVKSVDVAKVGSRGAVIQDRLRDTHQFLPILSETGSSLGST
jgi:hypothetical protein